jgi:5-methylcytosine-specific restriction endonuclease McrA
LDAQTIRLSVSSSNLFYQRWKKQDEEDSDIFIFRDYRQQDKESVIRRDQIIKQAFFQKNPDITHTDPQRLFTEAQRIAIYRRDKGLCQACLAEGLPAEDARVSWEEFEADHIIPYCKRGETKIENAQLLCRKHNRSLGAKDR